MSKETTKFDKLDSEIDSKLTEIYNSNSKMAMWINPDYRESCSVTAYKKLISMLLDFNAIKIKKIITAYFNSAAWEQLQEEEKSITIFETRDKEGLTKPTPEERIDAYPEYIQEAAYTILKNGDAFQFIFDAWSRRHVGDEILGKNCLCSAITGNILDSSGLPVKPSGASGKGKSSGFQDILNLLPEHMYLNANVSPKYLFYDNKLKPGMIIYSDDVNLKPDMIDTIKQATSDFQKPTEYRTLKDQDVFVGKIPKRTTFWLSSVEGFEDPQIANRFLQNDIDESPEQDKKVMDHIKESELARFFQTDEDVQVCRCIFEILSARQYNVLIPYMDAVEWHNPSNRRNLKKFMDIARSVTFYNLYQREIIRSTDGREFIVSTVEDFQRAISIYAGTARNNATNLTKKEEEVFECIRKKSMGVTINDIVHETTLSRQNIRNIIKGKDGNGGLLLKTGKIGVEKKTLYDEDRNQSMQVELFKYYGAKKSIEEWGNEAVAVIDKNKAMSVTKDFVNIITTSPKPSETPMKSLTGFAGFQRYSGLDDIIKANVSKNEIINNKIQYSEEKEENNNISITFFDSRVSEVKNTKKSITESSIPVTTELGTSGVSQGFRGIETETEDTITQGFTGHNTNESEIIFENDCSVIPFYEYK